MAPPGYKVRLLQDNIVVTSKLYTILIRNLHLLRKTGWTLHTFHLVAWEAHERAFHRLPRFSHHYTSKLLHGLVNKNKQNNLYYGKSSLCPLCNTYEETLSHVLTCSHEKALTSRTKSLTQLTDTLLTIRTPQPAIEAILHGFASWNPMDHTPARALTAGSLCSPDAVLTTAFHEQYNTIGWFQFCLGRVSKKWAAAVKQYCTDPQPPDFKEYWTSLWVNSQRTSTTLNYKSMGQMPGLL
jgi:hypothetical protein